MKIKVFVQAVKSRAALGDTMASLAQSDARKVSKPVVDDPGDMRRSFMRVLKEMAEADADLVIRLEDDVLVNRNILANVARWSALDEPDFGAGWLWQSLGLFDQCCQGREAEDDGRRAIYSKVTTLGNVKRTTRLTTGSLGVVMRPAMVNGVIAVIGAHWDLPDVKGQQDLALTSALFELGRYVYLHNPPLVEHNVAWRSLLAPDRPVHPMLHTTGGRFDENWKAKGT